MAKKSAPETPAVTDEAVNTTAPEGVFSVSGSDAGEAEEDMQLPPPQQFNGEVLPIVEVAATTITGCTDNELKNYLATTDYVCRTIALHMAERWKHICRTAKLKSDEGDSPKVPLAISVVINHENLLLMDTKVKTSFSFKHQEQAETQVDLRQVEFHLSSNAPDAEDDEAA